MDRFFKKMSFSFFVGIALFVVIIVTKIFFHRGVYLVDVLTGQPVKDISINISIWRILYVTTPPLTPFS